MLYSVKVFLLCALFVSAWAAEAESDLKQGGSESAGVEDPQQTGEKGQLCEKYPNLDLCHLQTVLSGAMEEVETLMGDSHAAGKLFKFQLKEAFAFITVSILCLEQVEKRKSAFVRFGKRKNAFVRFGRASQEQEEKRKSSYIRFG